MTVIRDLQLFVRRDDGEGPVIVYLHGINSDAGTWGVVIDKIGPSYRHIAPDLLGFGKSPKPTDIDYSADDHAEAIDATLDRLGIDEPFLLVGYSLGGDIAIRYAATFPHRVRRLFLLSAPFYLPPEEFGAAGFGVQYVQKLVFEWLWRVIAGAKKENDLLYQLAEGRLQDAVKQFLRTDDISAHWDIMSKNLENCIAKATFADDLRALGKMPVTFALGVRDVIVHPDQTPALKTIKPDMEIRRIVGLNADHFVLASLPEKVAHEICRDEIGTLPVALRKGAGDPPIVLLHGLNTTGRDMKPLADILAADHDVIALDLLGFGSSRQSQTLQYTLADHTLAVANSMRLRFRDRPARLVGIGIGANIALGVAARAPGLVADVVAIAPTLVPPGADAMDADRTDEAEAQAIAAREALDRVACDPRLAAIAGDRTLQRAVPMQRTIENVALGVDAERLLAAQSRPVRFVMPRGEHAALVAYVREVARRHDGFEVSEPTGEPDLAFSAPATAAREIAPDDPPVAVRAAETRPKPARHRAPLLDVVRSVENQMVVRGLLEMILGVVILALDDAQLDRTLLTLGFAIWVVWEGAVTMIGSFGLRREQKRWVGYFLFGIVAALAGGFLLLNQDVSTFVIGLAIALRAAYVGASNILVARAVGHDAPKPKWLLYAQGALGIAIGLIVILVPSVGGPLLRIALGVYFLESGVLLIGQAFVSKWRVSREIRRLSYDS